MFNNNFVTAVRVAGKILREDNGAVQIPFGSEYSLLLKNKNSVRALVCVEIDGVDATGGTSLIVGPNQSIDFERFIKNGNMSAGLKFKFIERTAAVEAGPRGIGADDGIVRIEFEFERPQPRQQYATRSLMSLSKSAEQPRGFGGNFPSFGDSFGSASIGDFANPVGVTNCLAQSASASAMPQNDIGITVGGSVSNQSFTQGEWFPTDGVKHVMCLSLRGHVGEQLVQAPITVKTKRECPSCGKLNTQQSKFCQECGTGLIKV